MLNAIASADYEHDERSVASSAVGATASGAHGAGTAAAAEANKGNPSRGARHDNGYAPRESSADAVGMPNLDARFRGASAGQAASYYDGTVPRQGPYDYSSSGSEVGSTIPFRRSPPGLAAENSFQRDRAVMPPCYAGGFGQARIPPSDPQARGAYYQHEQWGSRDFRGRNGGPMPHDRSMDGRAVLCNPAAADGPYPGRPDHRQVSRPSVMYQQQGWERHGPAYGGRQAWQSPWNGEIPIEIYARRDQCYPGYGYDVAPNGYGPGGVYNSNGKRHRDQRPAGPHENRGAAPMGHDGLQASAPKPEARQESGKPKKVRVAFVAAFVLCCYY